MTKKSWWRTLGVVLTASALLAIPVATSAAAYSPSGSVIVQLDDDEPCLKGRGNCIIYPKSAQLQSGRIVMGFEKSTVVPASGGAEGQTLPVYKSDDDGETWQPLAEVAAPAYLSDDPKYAPYTSNWTNPNFYVMPETVGDIEAGTLLLATVVSGEDAYYKERKAADPDWVPDNDGDRENLAIALFASTDEGVNWSVLDIVATGGWQGGSAGAIGENISSANTTAQVDPLWEPYLMVHDGKLVCFYSDENDYIGYDAETGEAIIDPDNATAPDSHGQILAHRTWNGTADPWSRTVVDVTGSTDDMGGGKTVIGGGRPGMTTVVPTSDGQWLMTFEYFNDGAGNRYKVADDPETFAADGDPDGTRTVELPLSPGSRGMGGTGSPVLTRLPDGRILYNGGSSGNIWVNETGSLDGSWTEFQSPLGSGYSRPLQYVEGTGQIMIFQASWGGPSSPAAINRADVDLGNTAGEYYRVVNRKTGEVIGTGGHVNDANIGNNDTPDVASEPSGSATDPDTQYWHVVEKADGKSTLINKSGGREAAIWTGNAVVGQRIGQWVDTSDSGLWNLVDAGDGYVRFQSAQNEQVYLTGEAGSPLTLQEAQEGGSQDWQLVEAAPVTIEATATSDMPGENGWFRGPATVELALTSGTAAIEYRLDSGEWTPYESPVRIATEGTHEVAYRGSVGGDPVEDSNGVIAVSIDTLAPEVTGAVEDGHLSADATDAGSGVALVEYRIGSGEWLPFSDGVAVAAGADLGLRARDAAGNQSAPFELSVPAAPGAGEPAGPSGPEGSSGAGSSELAQTGAPAAVGIAGALLLLVTGAALVLLRLIRRRSA